MKPRITLITLCVDDLERSVQFYRDGLGLPTQGIIGKEFEYGAVAFFDLQPGLKLAVWPRKSLAHDAGIPVGTPSPTELSIGHNVSSIAEVDAVMEQAKTAGAVIVKSAQKTFCQPLFDKWLKGTRLVGEVESVRFLSPDVALLHVLGGTVMREKSRPSPERDSIQTLVAIKRSGEWRLAAFQNTRVRPMGRNARSTFIWLFTDWLGKVFGPRK